REHKKEKYHLPFRKGHIPLNKKNLDEQLVLDLYQNGLPGDPNGSSTNKIAAYLGCHKSLVSRIVKKYGMLRFRRLTQEEQAKAVTLYEQGLSGPTVAKQLGV